MIYFSATCALSEENWEAELQEILSKLKVSILHGAESGGLYGLDRTKGPLGSWETSRKPFDVEGVS